MFVLNLNFRAKTTTFFCQLTKMEFLARKIQIERLELRVIFKHCVRVIVFSQIRKDTEKFDDEKKLFTIGTFYQLAKKKSE